MKEKLTLSSQCDFERRDGIPSQTGVFVKCQIINERWKVKPRKLRDVVQNLGRCRGGSCKLEVSLGEGAIEETVNEKSPVKECVLTDLLFKEYTKKATANENTEGEDIYSKNI